MAHRFARSVTRDPVLAVAIITLMFSSFFIGVFLFDSLSGYQSMTAEWYQVVWPNAQTGTKTFTKPLSGTVFNWNPDATGVETNGAIPDGTDDLSTISGSVENPKFDRHPDGAGFYNSWWINDTVTEASPNGTARHFEWSIDIYTMNVNFRAVGGLAYFINPPQIWVELQNNFDSVFTVLGAEGAASYVIYAQTESYSWAPPSAGWHIVDPTVGDFEIKFLDGSTALPPGIPQEGSNLDFDSIERYSHVALPFVLTQFGTAPGGSEPVVNMVVELSILTLGRFDYILTYESGGENKAAPIGALGVLDSIGAALGAGYSALMDGLSGVIDAAAAPFVAFAVVIGLGMVLIVVLRYTKREQKLKQH